MSFKTMLVLLDEAEDSNKRLDVACNLAEQHDAHLTALAMTLQINPYVFVSPDVGATTIDAEMIEEARERANGIATAAKQRVNARSLLGDVRWTSSDSLGVREVAAIQGRFADLSIVGQPIDGRCRGLREAALEGALFSSGRPVLLIPDNLQGPMNVRRIVVAWDASRQSARALSDAAQFLENAEETTVVVVDPEPGRQGFGADPGTDIAPVLARHCSNVILDRIPSSGASVAQALLTRTIDASGDLIVMGGYGHSSLRESLLGGVTRDMMEQTTIPILLSH